MNTLRVQLWLTVLVTVGLIGGWRNAAAQGPQVYAGPAAQSSFLVDAAGVLDAWVENGDSLGMGG